MPTTANDVIISWVGQTVKATFENSLGNKVECDALVTEVRREFPHDFWATFQSCSNFKVVEELPMDSIEILAKLLYERKPGPFGSPEAWMKEFRGTFSAAVAQETCADPQPKPCPECGSTNIVKRKSPVDNKSFVGCACCGKSTKCKDTPKEAWEDWSNLPRRKNKKFHELGLNDMFRPLGPRSRGRLHRKVVRYDPRFEEFSYSYYGVRDDGRLFDFAPNQIVEKVEPE